MGGSGGSTFEISRRIGADGTVWGVDISKPMLDIATARLTSHGIGNVKFSEADVTTFDFTDHFFDVAFSRFGVMFFEDPVASFSSIANSLKSKGVLAFCCWRSLNKNEWFELPLNVGLKYCDRSDPMDAAASSYAPGPMAFNNQDRISEKNSTYFSNYHSYLYHTSSNNYIYNYSFAVDPEKYQPTGSVNMTGLPSFSLISNIITPHSSDYSFNLYMYHISYNVLKIMGGMGSLGFSI